MKKNILTLLFIIMISHSQIVISQNIKSKLIIGIVIDQMRPDYLTRFEKNFGNGGFKRIIENGTTCKNVTYNYIPTFTAPGHASIYTGTTPKFHGIISNSWYDKKTNKSVYCVSDTNYQTVGSTSKNGQKSPNRLLTTTITDQFKILYQHQNKVIGISIKDRGAILPGGHTANAAYWYDKSNGNFITSTYYMNELPNWVNKFNNKKLANKYLNQIWKTFLPIKNYTNSENDFQSYEIIFKGKKQPTFPYNLKKLRHLNGDYAMLPTTVYGNTILTDFAIDAITNENLGKNSIPDFLTISYSSTDYIGHAFGAQSKEIEDCYVRMDREIERLLTYLDKQLGNENYTLFITSDHACAETIGYLKKHHLPGDFYSEKEMKKNLQKFLISKYKNSLKNNHSPSEFILKIQNNQIFINHSLCEENNINSNEIIEFLIQKIYQNENIAYIFSKNQLLNFNTQNFLIQNIYFGYNEQMSGDIVFVHRAGWMPKIHSATTHGTSYSYDAHVPLLWFGNKIPQKIIYTPYHITDISYTLSMLFGIPLPNSTIGKPILEIL